MANKTTFVLIALWAILPALSAAAQVEPNICGVSLDQDAKAIPAALERRSAGPVVFVDPRWPDKKLHAERLYLHAHTACAGLMIGSDANVDAPDIIVDIAGASSKRVIAIAFKPRMQDCRAIKELIAAILGVPTASNVEAAEWTVPELKRRILVTDGENSCWIHHQRTLP